MIFFKPPEDFLPKFKAMGCFIMHGEEFPLLHRLAHKNEGDTWGLPSGKFDSQKDDSIHAGMVREIKEETGLTYPSLRLVPLSTLYVRFADYDFIYTMYKLIVNIKPQIVINPNEHDAYLWVTADEALNMKLIEDLDECIKLAFG